MGVWLWCGCVRIYKRRRVVIVHTRLDRIRQIAHDTICVMTFLRIRFLAVAFLAAHLETGRLMNVKHYVYMCMRVCVHVCVRLCVYVLKLK